MTTADDLLTVGDVAQLCRVHQTTVRRHIAAGQLRSVRVGRAVRVRKADLETYLEPKPAVAKARSRAGWRRLGGKPFTKDDTLWNIVGMISIPEDAWVSGDKHRALAEAYAPRE